jgi:pimeloyl-ACP methyl ester carboxylesterase
VVIFDQRGVGRSTPPLSCAVETVIVGEPPCRGRSPRAPPGCVAGASTSVRTPRRRTRPTWPAIGAALGAPKVDLYGASYGSRLALTVMRDHPDAVRSVVLDAPVPLEADLAAEFGGGFDRSVRRVFAACAADRRCNRAYPRLEARLLLAYRRLNRTPVRVRPVDLRRAAAARRRASTATGSWTWCT